MKLTNAYPAKPFVKWVGGKTQLLDDIKKTLPHDLLQRTSVTYVEPFVGGGAVMFWILQEFPNITKAIINDINAELICTYRVIKHDVEGLINVLSRLQEEYLLLDDDKRKEYFLTQRDRFNEDGKSDVDTAALFIFLNRTCFNGVYRVNSQGKFNVPHGKYKNPKICDADTLRADSELLQRVEILCGDFEQTGNYAGNDVFYYLDPPYRPLTETSAFTSYTKDGFDDAEQKRLCDFCSFITSRGSLFVESNSDPMNVDGNDKFFDNLYKTFHIKRVYASRMINANGDGRGSVSEILISNFTNPYRNMRDFNAWLEKFRPSIADYKYYTDFDKVFRNVESIKIPLNILNSLIGSKRIEDDFKSILIQYPETLKCIPILLAKREYEIMAIDEEGEFKFRFDKPNYTTEDYIMFMRKTGLFDLMENHIVNNLVDYVTGVETGLDSNARKNRGGHLMENLVESFIRKAGFKKEVNYFKEMYIHEIEEKWGIDLSSISNEGKAEKRFDFVVKGENMIYGIETNFYTSSGSKLNETARSYKTITMETKDLSYFKFIWFTDGHGWYNAKNNLQETFDVLEHLYNISDLENGIISTILI